VKTRTPALQRDALRALNDPLLTPLFDAEDDEQRREAIGAVLERVRPLVTALVRRFQRGECSMRADDAEELIASVTLRVLRKLQLTAVLESEAVAKLEGYVATLTQNALHDFRRRRFPERTRLRNKVRYLVTHDPRFRASTDGDEMVCTLARPVPASEAAMRDAGKPADAVAAVLARAGEPVALSTLLDTLLELWNIHEPSMTSDPAPLATPADQLSALESREAMRMLWTEVQGLPQNQRAALLLNLRDGHGGNALTLILLLGIAGAAEIAAAAGMAESELSEVWPRLPLDDLTIAERLGLTRQQVINLRNSARARLARRTREKRGPVMRGGSGRP
jgi:hypothetical protein